METMHRVKELAAEQQMSLYQLAEACEIPYDTLKRANRRNSQLRMSTIEKICNGVGITVNEFFEDAGRCGEP